MIMRNLLLPVAERIPTSALPIANQRARWVNVESDRGRTATKISTSSAMLLLRIFVLSPLVMLFLALLVKSVTWLVLSMPMFPTLLCKALGWLWGCAIKACLEAVGLNDMAERKGEREWPSAHLVFKVRFC